MNTVSELILNITSGRRAAHAFICEGRPGSSRDRFITSLAQGLECTCSDAAARPCGMCPDCRQVAAGTHMDVVRMNKSTGSGRTARASYKTSDAAAFIERLAMDPYGRCLIGIIDDADMMSEVVQNKLLKTLEEPSPDTILLLACSNRDNLLDTVRSRCSDIRITDMDILTEDAERGLSDAVMQDMTSLMYSRRSRFHEFRAAADKHIKTREDALELLDHMEDILRSEMTRRAGVQPDQGEPVQGSRDAGTGRKSGQTGNAGGALAGMSMGEIARCVEVLNTARADIRREMAYSRVLRRMYLELR